MFVKREALVVAAARVCAISLLALAAISTRAVAQHEVPDGQTRLAAASRAELDGLATRAEAAAQTPSMPNAKRDSLRRFAAELRTRLRDGDFQPNDRMIIVTRGDSTRVDTLTVQSDRTVTLAQSPPIALDGVLRSELQSHLSDQLHRYVKREIVRATPLVSVGVLGEVVHPGYYRVPLQMTLGDLLMVAGGPSPQADMSRVQIRRGQTTFVDARTVRNAMARGLPLGQLGIDAGDEVVLAPVRQRNWLLIAQLAGVATGILLTLRTFKAF